MILKNQGIKNILSLGQSNSQSIQLSQRQTIALAKQFVHQKKTKYMYKPDHKKLFISNQAKIANINRLIKQNNSAYLDKLKLKAKNNGSIDRQHKRIIGLIKQNGRQNMLTFIRHQAQPTTQFLKRPTLEQNVDYDFKNVQSLNQQLHFQIPTNLQNYIQMKKKLAQKGKQSLPSKTKQERRILPKAATIIQNEQQQNKYLRKYNAWYIPVQHWSKPVIPQQTSKIHKMKSDPYFIYKQLYKIKPIDPFNPKDQQNQKIKRAKIQLLSNKQKLKSNAVLVQNLRSYLKNKGYCSPSLDIRLRSINSSK